MSLRLKLIGVSLLLCVALVGTVFAAAGTVQAYQSFQENHRLAMAGDVSTVRSWMTLPYISHVYRVPAPCLYGSLHISASALRKHATLGYLATYYKWPVNSLVHDVQRVILDYRQKRIICSSSGANFRALTVTNVAGATGDGPLVGLVVRSG